MKLLKKTIKRKLQNEWEPTNNPTEKWPKDMNGIHRKINYFIHKRVKITTTLSYHFHLTYGEKILSFIIYSMVILGETLHNRFYFLEQFRVHSKSEQIAQGSHTLPVPTFHSLYHYQHAISGGGEVGSTFVT